MKQYHTILTCSSWICKMVMIVCIRNDRAVAKFYYKIILSNMITCAFCGSILSLMSRNSVDDVTHPKVVCSPCWERHSCPAGRWGTCERAPARTPVAGCRHWRSAGHVTALRRDEPGRRSCFRLTSDVSPGPHSLRSTIIGNCYIDHRLMSKTE